MTIYTNKYNLPNPVVKALTSYDKGDAPVEGLRVTTLIDSPQISLLKQKHSHELTEDVSDRAWMVLGTAVHEIFERAASNAYISEERLSHTVGDTLISGAIDYQFETDNEVDLKDYKTTTVYAVQEPKKEWERQLNTYAYLVRHVKLLSVKSASVIAILKDWRQADVDRRSNYPPASIMEIPVKLWSDEEQDEYVEERVRLHNHAKMSADTGPTTWFGKIPPCTDGERWAKPAVYAVHKGSNTRALKGGLFADKSEAQVFAGESADRVLIERPRTYTRCVKNYCRVADFCSQYNEEVKK